MPRRGKYYAYVPRKTLVEVLAENTKALMLKRGLKQATVSENAARAGKKIDQRTVGRVCNAEFPAQVPTLEGLAAGIGVEPWQLLVPGLDPSALPRTAPMQPDLSATELEQVERVLSEIGKLNPAQRDFFIQDGVVGEILSQKYFPPEQMRGNWTSPQALQEPPGKYNDPDGGEKK